MTGGAGRRVLPQCGTAVWRYITRLISGPLFVSFSFFFKSTGSAPYGPPIFITHMINKEYDLPGDWLTVPAEDDNGALVIVTGRTDVAKFRDNPRFNIRLSVRWRYGDAGMPDTGVSTMMQTVTEMLAKEFKKDPVAVLTGIYTGAGLREWVFYTLSLPIFGRKLNETLAALPVLPLEISAESDADWDEYAEMRQVVDSVE